MINFDDIYEELKGAVTEDWVTGKTSERLSFKLKNRSITEKIQRATDSDIEAQFWMSSGKNNINFEFANDFPEYRELRIEIASSFREFIFTRDYPDWLQRSRGSTVSHVTLADKEGPEVKILVKQFYTHINSLIYQWAAESDLGLLTPQSSKFLIPSKIAEFKTETAKMRAVARMVKTAKETVAGANGQETLQKVKEKENRFATNDDFNKYVSNILEAQNGLCAITRLALQFDAQVDDQELQASLDRIDSNGHYEPGNLQIVCRFINRWKSDGNDAEFRRLMALIRESGTSVMAQPLGGRRATR